jgi:hypothetical protein
MTDNYILQALSKLLRETETDKAGELSAPPRGVCVCGLKSR